MTIPIRTALRAVAVWTAGAMLTAAALAATPAEQADDFVIAARNDNVGAMTRLLDAGLDPNARNGKGQTGLTVAVQDGASKAARWLLARPGIDIDRVNGAGESPLMMAAIKGDLPAVRLLIERGAQVNQSGWTALHYAACGPEPKVIALLLERGADLEAPSPNATTPLMMAAQYGSEDNVRLLLSRGADAARRNQQGQQAVDFARRSDREPVVRLLAR